MTTAVEEKSAAVRAGLALAITAAITALTIVIFGDAAYLWIKSVHVIAIISWMAGLLYLPRLFIYHCDAPKGSVQSETFKV
ncbi:MAG: CopD family protein, partial [Deltaproteobacteria bacterium]